MPCKACNECVLTKPERRSAPAFLFRVNGPGQSSACLGQHGASGAAGGVGSVTAVGGRPHADFGGQLQWLAVAQDVDADRLAGLSARAT